MKLGIFVAALPPDLFGGTEIQAERMARELVARGHQVHIFARRQSSAPEPPRGGVRVWRRPLVRIPGLRPIFELVLGVRQAMAVSCDVLLCYIALNSGVLGWLTHRFTGVPFVIWVRGVDELQVASRPGVRSRVCVFLFQRCNELWLQSRSLAQQLQAELERIGAHGAWKRIEPRIRIFANGLDLPAHVPDTVPDPERFVFVGRLSPEKDLPTLLAAMRLVPGARLDIIGDGPMRASLHARADAAQVRFLGALDRDQVDAQLAAARGLVLSSTAEGLPNAVLEALALGRPVVATSVGAVPELIEDGGNGFLVRPGDREAIAEAIRKLQDDGRWRVMANEARRSVERFGWSRLVPEVETRLESLRAAAATTASAR